MGKQVCFNRGTIKRDVFITYMTFFTIEPKSGHFYEDEGCSSQKMKKKTFFFSTKILAFYRYEE